MYLGVCVRAFAHWTVGYTYNIILWLYLSLSHPAPQFGQLSPRRKFIYYNKHFNLKISKSIQLTTFPNSIILGKEKSFVLSSPISVFVTLAVWLARWMYSIAALHFVSMKIKPFAAYWRTSAHDTHIHIHKMVSSSTRKKWNHVE